MERCDILSCRGCFPRRARHVRLADRMPDHSERYIKIYDLTVCPARVHGSPPTMLETSDFDRLSRAVKAAAAARTPLGDDEDSRGRKLYLMDMDVGRNHVTLVWTLADPNAAAQMYLKRGGTGLRAAAKDDDEDVALSAHMVINFDVPQNTMRYRVALEDHEGVSRTRIQALFQTLLQENLPSVTAVLAEGVTKPGPPRVHLDAHPGRLMGQTATKPVTIDVVKLTRRRTMTAGVSDAYYQAMDRRVFKLARDGAVAERNGSLTTSNATQWHRVPISDKISRQAPKVSRQISSGADKSSQILASPTGFEPVLPT
jgi:hypothetical protein